MGFAAAAAAARSAFVVPGRFDAELKVPNRLEGLGATMFALGRAAATGPGLPFAATSPGRLTRPLVAAPDLLVSRRLEVTVMRLVAGWLVLSPSLARLDPTGSADAESAMELLGGESTFPALALFCFLLVEAAALSMTFWASSLMVGPPFLVKRGSNFAMFVF